MNNYDSHSLIAKTFHISMSAVIEKKKHVSEKSHFAKKSYWLQKSFSHSRLILAITRFR